MYIVRNISKVNIVIGKNTLRPNMEMKTSDLEPLSQVIKLGYVLITEIKENDNIYNQYLSQQKLVNDNDKISDDNFDKDKTKKQLIDSFFNFYLLRDVSDDNLKILKWFYKKIGFTSNIKSETLQLIDDVENYEELIEVLLNNVYPELLDKHLNE